MAKNIYIEYTNPVTGVQSLAQATFDIERYRVDTEQGAIENFFLKASASGVQVVMENIDDLISDLLDGKPSSHRYGVVQSLIDTAFTANGTTLSVLPAADVAGFVANIPCVVMDKYGNVKDWFIPSAVEADFTIPATGPASLEVDCKIGWIVQQAKSFASPLGENSQLGVKAQLEKLTAATAVTGSGTVSGGINVSWTKPSDVVLKYFDIYCYKASVQPTLIEPNALPSVADRASGLGSTNVNLTQYFDEATMALVNLTAGDYFVALVAKDAIGQFEVNESALAWSAMITIA
jgi:hypothetical protein